MANLDQNTNDINKSILVINDPNSDNKTIIMDISDTKNHSKNIKNYILDKYNNFKIVCEKYKRFIAIFILIILFVTILFDKMHAKNKQDIIHKNYTL